MKLVMPHGGYGLGNEMIPWAKAYILAQEIGATLLHPAWGNNPRRYGEYFRTFRWDWQWYRVLARAFPRVPFEEDVWLNMGTQDFRTAAQRFAEMHDLYKRRHVLVSITGLWGAFQGLEPAIPFIRSKLLATAHTLDNLYRIRHKLDRRRLVVGFHVRRGDFWPPGESFEGVNNVAVPLEWYLRVSRSLVAQLGRDAIQFVVATDAEETERHILRQELGAVITSDLPYSVCSDLLTLADSDLLVCSLSSYSRFAAFLSDAPYLWFRPHLSATDDMLYLKSVRLQLPIPECTPASPYGIARGLAVDWDGVLPDALIDILRATLARKDPNTDLIRSRCCPRLDCSPPHLQQACPVSL